MHDPGFPIQPGGARGLPRLLPVPILLFAAAMPLAGLVHPYAAEVMWGLSALVLLRVQAKCDQWDLPGARF